MRHAGTTGIHANRLALRIQGDDLAQHRKDLFADLRLHVDVLQAAQQAWNVVARAGVQLNRGYVHDTEG